MYEGTRFLGQAILAQLQTLQNTEYAIGKWWDLLPDLESKKKRKNTVEGSVYVKIFYSTNAEKAGIHKKLSNDVYLYPKFKDIIKSGDIILYDGFGFVPALVKSETLSPFSSIGLVMTLPNKWTLEDELYVVEITRNVNLLKDAMTEKPEQGVLIFKLFERLHQYHGKSIWWSPILKEISPESHAKVREYIESIRKDVDLKQLLSKVKDDRLINPHLVKSLSYINELGHRATAVMDVTGTNFVIEALKLFGVRQVEVNMNPSEVVMSPDFGEPFPLRMDESRYNDSMLPPGLRETKEETTLLALQEKEQTRTRRAKELERARRELKFDDQTILRKAKESTIGIDTSEDTLIQIMQQGGTFTIVHNKIKEKRMYLLESEDEIVCGSKRIRIRDIFEVREGFQSIHFEKFRDEMKPFEGKGFSILYGKQGRKGGRCISVVSKTAFEYRFWSMGLQMLLNNLDHEFATVKMAYRKMKTKKLKMSQARKLLEKINYTGPSAFIKEKFEIVDINRDNYLHYPEFIYMLKLLLHRNSIQDLFQTYSEGNEVMTLAQFKAFLSNEQNENVTDEDALKLIHTVATGSTLSILEFESYLVSSENEVTHPEVLKVPTSLDHPITSYFISCSHNTYLEGHQLVGQSSTEQYIRVLRSGCRCVELDCWDGDDGNPIIYHGYTLTSKITFENACIAIKSYAFDTSPYPIILSLENHCSVEQQNKMAEIIKRVFGDSILTPDDWSEVDSMRGFPSAEKLREKILLKGSMLVSVNEKFLRALEDGENNQALIDEILEEEEDEEEEDQKKAKKVKVKISDALSQSIYLKSNRFKSFEKNQSQKPWEITSFEEKNTKRLSKAYYNEFIRFNLTHFSRIYPKGFRFNSSNFNPYYGWSVGSQLIALNWQTPCDYLYYNEAMFKRNGNCGYVLKPPHLIDPSASTINRIEEIEVTILDGRQLPKNPNEDVNHVVAPRVHVILRGNTTDSQSDKTSTAKNGYSPTWNEVKTFKITESWCAALILIVRDGNSDKDLAHFSVMVEDIREGYRIMPLYDQNSRLIPLANLFCKIKLKRVSENP